MSFLKFLLASVVAAVGIGSASADQGTPNTEPQPRTTPSTPLDNTRDALRPGNLHRDAEVNRYNSANPNRRKPCESRPYNSNSNAVRNAPDC